MRARIVIVVVMVVAAAALGAVKWASAAAPLSADVTSTAPIGMGKPLAGPIPTFHYRRGAAYYSELSIKNSSRVPVTVTGVDETGDASMRVILRLNGIHEPGVNAKTTPFHPVSIAAGEGQASTTVVSIPLTFTMLKGVVKGSQWVDIVRTPQPDHRPGGRRNRSHE